MSSILSNILFSCDLFHSMGTPCVRYRSLSRLAEQGKVHREMKEEVYWRRSEYQGICMSCLASSPVLGRCAGMIKRNYVS